MEGWIAEAKLSSPCELAISGVVSAILRIVFTSTFAIRIHIYYYFDRLLFYMFLVRGKLNRECGVVVT